MNRTTTIDRPADRARGLGLAVALLIGLVLALVGATGVSAKPKPGFLPGTWIGKGTITGTSTDGPMTVHFSGGIAFTLKVAPSLAAKGSGTWRLDMLGSEDAMSNEAVDSTMQGRAAIALRGSGSRIRFAGLQRVVGEIRSAGRSTPISFTRPLEGTLAITRAGKCKVSGTTVLPDGVKLVWNATLEGSSTCRA